MLLRRMKWVECLALHALIFVFFIYIHFTVFCGFLNNLALDCFSFWCELVILIFDLIRCLNARFDVILSCLQVFPTWVGLYVAAGTGVSRSIFVTRTQWADYWLERSTEGFSWPPFSLAHQFDQNHMWYSIDSNHFVLDFLSSDEFLKWHGSLTKFMEFLSHYYSVLDQGRYR